ncbi:phosphotransferase family protein [Goodfellowiella coeruleoviolacea]|uniref:Kinase, aminoglycoside phosphotransferase (APT) family n=1 Tax=Goodfellowiella coeruleoviolacea TaxID=334858 RepID=A0AAE3KJ00_9PSEU|nr:aminoglycoside phosphotransferase family protein [Goodfellowiella coeruleoviolacea]MCP2169040.1 putative kinase, aminoglycoside phosphotransferase (APT) family [Goodfellowiella coeruleoviolacea]
MTAVPTADPPGQQHVGTAGARHGASVSGRGGAREPAVAPGRFTLDKLHAALARICAGAGLDHRGATLLRFTNNAVFQLASHPVVVRIVGSVALRHRVRKVVRVANWLAEHDVPAVRLLPGVAQPVRAGEHLATLWLTVPSGHRRADGRDLAVLLRRLHRLPPPDGLPPWQPLDDVRRRLADAEELAAEDREFLERRCAEIETQLAELRFPLPPAVVHGDAHVGNVILGRHGPVLCDFDSTCLGPPEWDLTALPVGVARLGHPSQWYRQLVAEYGFDVTGWSGYPVLRQVRELKLTTSVLPILRSNPAVRDELHRRLADFRAGNTSSTWSPYR